MAPLGAGDRSGRRRRDRRLVRALRRGPRGHGGVAGSPARRLAGTGPYLRPRLLVAVTRLPAGGGDRRRPHHEQRRRRTARLVARHPGGRLSRGAGCGDRGRPGQPAVGTRRYAAQHYLLGERTADRAHRRRRPHRRDRRRCGVRPPGVSAEGARGDPGGAGSGIRRLSPGTAGAAVPGGPEDRGSGWPRSPQGHDRRYRPADRRRLALRHDFPRAPGAVRWRAIAQRNEFRGLLGDSHDAVRGARRVAPQSLSGGTPRALGVAGDKPVPGGVRCPWWFGRGHGPTYRSCRRGDAADAAARS